MIVTVLQICGRGPNEDGRLLTISSVQQRPDGPRAGGSQQEEFGESRHQARVPSLPVIQRHNALDHRTTHALPGRDPWPFFLCPRG